MIGENLRFMFNRLLVIFLCLLSQNLSAQIINPDFKKLLDSTYQHTVPLISVEDLRLSDKKNLFILDAREEEEFAVSHLKEARHVGYFWFDMRNVYNIPKDATVVVYCSVGFRSEKIGDKLLKAGYLHVYNLHGSIFEWVNQRNPVYRSNGVQTTEVHGFNKNWGKWLERGAVVY